MVWNRVGELHDGWEGRGREIKRGGGGGGEGKSVTVAS